MLVLDYKAYGNAEQYRAIDEALRTAQFIQNKALRLWVDSKDNPEKVGKYDLNKYCAVLAKEFDFANRLNSTARQASAERAWAAISRFYDNCKKGVKPVGYPRFKKNVQSVEYKHSGWKLSALDKRITFTDGFNIGTLKLKGTYDLALYPVKLIKRVRLVRKADGYYVQFAINVDRHEDRKPTGKAIGLDVGLESFYTDSEGVKAPNARFLRKAEKQLKKLSRQMSRKQKGSNNRRKARVKLARKHLQVARQRKDHAVKTARCVMMSNDFVAYENLQVKNLLKNCSLAKSISDASWSQFRRYLEYFGKVFGKATVAVAPQWTSQDCSDCGARVQKSLSTRTHVCKCGTVLDRDENAARNILQKALVAAGHVETENACGVDVSLTHREPFALKQEAPSL